MKAYTVDVEAEELSAIDIEIEANTVYTFFNSILIDESSLLAKHVVYSDADAMSAKKKPFFIGGQITFGDVLVLGRDKFEDMEATIPQDELELLIDYEVNSFYREVLELIASSGINLYRTFEVEKKGEKVALSIEWVLYTFNIADARTQEYFIVELKKVLDAEGSVEEYMKKMAALALNAAQ
jgi:hypothetical protein